MAENKARRASARPGPSPKRRPATARYVTATDVAVGRVIVRGASLFYTLAVNPGFRDPNVIDPARGVDMPEIDQVDAWPPEARIAEAAIVERLALQMVPSDAQLRPFIGAQMARRGGAGGLTDTLLALAPIPAGKDRRAYRASLLRSLERAGPAQKETRGQQHATIRASDYRARLGRLAFTETKNRVLLGVTGHWDMREKDEKYRRFNTNLETSDPDQANVDRRARRIAESADGAGFLALVVEIANRVTQPYGADLLVLHGLHIELQAPRRGRASARGGR